MAKRCLFVISAAALALLGGCILSDELTTLTIQPDGSADLVKVRSNIRSSEAGEKGAAELRQFIEDFDAHRDADHADITRAGGKVVDARWLRREEPYATLIVAKLPSASVIEELWTMKGDQGEVIAKPLFTRNEKRRKLSIEISVPKEGKWELPARATTQELREEQANGISETRIVVAGGRIVASQGFTVAGDGRSALLEPSRIREMLESGKEKLELFLEWEIAGN